MNVSDSLAGKHKSSSDDQTTDPIGIFQRNMHFSQPPDVMPLKLFANFQKQLVVSSSRRRTSAFCSLQEQQFNPCSQHLSVNGNMDKSR